MGKLRLVFSILAVFGLTTSLFANSSGFTTITSITYKNGNLLVFTASEEDNSCGNKGRFLLEDIENNHALVGAVYGAFYSGSTVSISGNNTCIDGNEIIDRIRIEG